MSINATNNEMNADLNSVISNEILSFVEEQFEREGSFAFLDHLNETTLSSLELQDQSLVPNCAAQRDYQSTITPKVEPVQNTALNLPFGQSFVSENQQMHREFGPSCAHQSVDSTGRLLQSQASLNTNIDPPPPLHHLDIQRPLQHDVSISSTQWNYQLPNHLGSVVAEPFTSSISMQNPKKRPFPSGVSLQPHSSVHHRQAWSQGQLQQNPLLNNHQTTDLGQTSRAQRSSFPGSQDPADTSQGFLQQSSSCMFSKPPSQVNGVCPGSEQPTGVSRPHCRFQEHQQNWETPDPLQNWETPDPLGSVPKTPSFSLDTRLQPQPYLVSQPTKMNWSVMGNGGFTSTSVPNGGTFCSEDR